MTKPKIKACGRVTSPHALLREYRAENSEYISADDLLREVHNALVDALVNMNQALNTDNARHKDHYVNKAAEYVIAVGKIVQILRGTKS